MENCSICKEDMNKEQNYMLSCNHRFHTSCLIDSLRINPECPIFRDIGNAIKKDLFKGHEIYNGDLYNNLNELHSMNHTDYCVFCSIKKQENQYYDIYNTLYEIINNDNELTNKKLEALKINRKLRKQILIINNTVKNDIITIWKEKENLIKQYYNNKIHSNDFIQIKDSLLLNKPLAQKFGKLLNQRLGELNMHTDSNVETVINYITYELYNNPFNENNKFYNCPINSFINKMFYNNLENISKKNKKVNKSDINIIT